jgi:hypothetical protein
MEIIIYVGQGKCTFFKSSRIRIFSGFSKVLPIPSIRRKAFQNNQKCVLEKNVRQCGKWKSRKERTNVPDT